MTRGTWFSTRVRDPNVTDHQNHQKVIFLYDVSNFIQNTLKSQSCTHGGLLNHVEKVIWKNSNSFIVSKLINVDTPPPLHDLWHFDIRYSKLWLKFKFGSWTLLGTFSRVPDRVLKVLWWKLQKWYVLMFMDSEMFSLWPRSRRSVVSAIPATTARGRGGEWRALDVGYKW